MPARGTTARVVVDGSVELFIEGATMAVPVPSAVARA